MTMRKKEQQRIKDKNRKEESKIRVIPPSPKPEESDIIKKDDKTIILKPKK